MVPPDVTQLLRTVPRGRRARVEGVSPNGQAARLREYGLCEGEQLEVLCSGDPMICRVGTYRLGICARLAAEVHVAPLP